MTERIALRLPLLLGAVGCAVLVAAALAGVVVAGPDRALISHLVEGTVAAIAWTALMVLFGFRGRPVRGILVIAVAWSVSAATGGWALLGGPSAVPAAWVSTGTWVVAAGLSFTIGLMSATRRHTSIVLTLVAVLSTATAAMGVAALPTVTVVDGESFPNAIAVPGAEVVAATGALVLFGTSFAVIAALALQATSPSRRRRILPVLAAAIVGIAGIAVGALANAWAPLVQSLTVSLLPLALAGSVLGSPSRGLRGLGTALDGAADPMSALATALDTLQRDLDLDGVAIRVEDVVLMTTGRPGDHALPLVHLSRIEGHLLVPAMDRDDADEVARVAPSIAAVLASARLIDEVRRSRTQLVIAREEERRRVRHDLHDELGPLLSAILMQADAATLALTTAPERSRRSLEKLRATGDDSILALRRIVRDLNPAAVDVLGLTGALHELAARLSGPVAVTVTATDVTALPAAVEAAVYRVAAEAAANAVRHSAASAVGIRLAMVDGVVRLAISDDGHGFDSTQTPAGVGLASMHRRVAELDGTLRISSTSAGTVVLAELGVPA